jgi:hypothetical protein
MDDLIPAQTIEAMADAYKRSQDNLEEASRLVEEAKSLMEGAFGRTHAISSKLSKRTFERSAKEVKNSAWQYIVKQTGMDDVMSRDRRKEFTEQLVNGDVPEPTAENIMSFLLQLRGDSGKYLEESVGQLFRMLRPSNGAYATNDEFKVGERVILEQLIEPQNRFHNTYINYNNAGDISLLDNIFHLLDGKGMPKQPYTLLAVLKEAIANSEWDCETEYFICKWFKKGTLHIKFKRMDLVKEINRIAGGGSLNKA